MRTTNVFISILSLCIAAAPAMAHKLAPTTVGAYYAGTKKPGNPITFTGGGSYDNDDQTDYDERPRWEWDFDYRGTFTADMNTRSWLANWTYAVPGTYTVAVKYFDDDGQPKPLEEDLRVLLYQAVSELLLNVVKHARARHVQVSIWREGETLRLGVYDDGVGFDTAAIRQRWGRREGGFGLFSTRERLRSYGGGLEVESRPGFGTQVVMTVPLQAEPGE